MSIFRCFDNKCHFCVECTKNESIMLKELNLLINHWLQIIQVSEKWGAIISTSSTAILILLFSLILFLISKKILYHLAHSISIRTKTEWDDILLKFKFFSGISHYVPATILYISAGFAEPYFPAVDTFILKISELYFLFTSIFTVNAFLSSFNLYYHKTFSFAKERPIAGFIQLIKIFIYFIGLLIFIAVVFDKELIKLLTGLGAIAAVLMLVFKDSILGFVASIQMSMNNMVKLGDWIEMPSKGADGTVVEINLTTVKVENWDKTISNIPTYSLVSESFVNWKGMEQSGGRRIKRSINIDMSSVKFCSQEMLEKFKKFVLIREYVENKQKEIDDFNSKLNVPPDQHFNGRRQTNLGIFRKYLEAYLRNHKMINQEMTFLVRHLQPTEKGIPIEIYVFCNDKRWAHYEAVQADIFDHILAVIPEFDLSVYQAPSGRDLAQIGKH